MAGVILKRLRLTTSRVPSYWRGGLSIGTTSAPTYLEAGEIELDQALEIVRDPNIALSFEDEEGGVQPLTDEERAEIEDGLMTALAQQPLTDPASGASDGEPDNSEPQGGGSDPAAEASKASGPEATADAGDGSAADAGTTEPSQPAAADPAPVDNAAAPAAPTSKGAAKPKTVKGKS